MKNLKILIVEDENKLAQLIKISIKELFFKVGIAKDGEEGLKKFHSFKPDIIISDITMPNLDGLEMCKRIREISNIPIIILSAYSQQERLLKAIDIGVSKYFIKPFDIENFIEYLKELSNKIDLEKRFILKDGFIFMKKSISLYKDDILINLTKREREFINLLILNKNELVNLNSIKNLLWTEEKISDERVRTFIKRLRVKTSKELIENISSQGYMISVLEVEA
ncbi:response regulator transcription factor [Arcobacter vandammei]|uniref:response regulator transcription factor n=1 Tax=Arcobacter vandammei TaxID=2782243 RepID=UPI0018E050C6|nr:response regulator transcription factor [Arcobacter vandammei]